MYLKTLIDSEPSNAGASDDDVLAWLQSAIATDVRASIGDVYRIFQAAGVDAEMETATDGSNGLEKKISRQFVRMVGQSHLADVDISHAKFQAGMTALVDSTTRFPSMKQSVKDEVDALMTVPRWEHPDNQPLKLPRNAIISILTLEHIQIARV